MECLPLTTDELEELTLFLLSDATPESVMMLDTLHGFLTGLAVSPGRLPQAEWLPLVWSEDGGEHPQFESARQEARIVSLIQRMLASVAGELDNPMETFEPLVALVHVGEETFRDGQQWSIGFMQAIALQQNEWTAFLALDIGQEIMLPILCLHEAGQSPVGEAAAETAKQCEEWTIALSDAVEDIAQWFLEQRLDRFAGAADNAGPLMSATPSTLDPCPCNSGRSIKECCGAPHRLH